MTAATFCLGSAGAFFLVGLLAGVWKYAAIATRMDARAPTYVDTAHRAALLYAFACGLLADVCRSSAWSDTVNFAAAAVLVSFFAASIAGYVVHGALQDTDNQFQRPHRLGRRTIPARAMVAFMVALSIGEIASFVVLLTGFIRAAR